MLPAIITIALTRKGLAALFGGTFWGWLANCSEISDDRQGAITGQRLVE